MFEKILGRACTPTEWTKIDKQLIVVRNIFFDGIRHTSIKNTMYIKMFALFDKLGPFVC